MPLALILFVIGWLIWEKIRKREGWNDLDRFWMFLLLSAAMLIKGPIIYAFLLPGIVAFAWRARAKGEAVTAWCGWWPWLASLAIFLLWAGAGILFVPEFLEHVVTREFAGRFSEGDASIAANLFLSAASPASVRALEHFADFVGDARGERATAENSRLAGRDVAGNILARCLESWGFAGHVLRSVQTDRSCLSDRAAALFAAGRSSLCVMEKRKVASRQPQRFCTIAVIIACLFTTGYAAGRIVVAYREQRDAFATFGSAVRQEAAARGWRYGVVGRDDEGVLLYLRGTEFLDADQAAEEWNSGKLDGLVLPEDQVAELLPRLPGAVPSSIGPSGPAGRYERRYLFLVRS